MKDRSRIMDIVFRTFSIKRTFAPDTPKRCLPSGEAIWSSASVMDACVACPGNKSSLQGEIDYRDCVKAHLFGQNKTDL